MGPLRFNSFCNKRREAEVQRIPHLYFSVPICPSTLAGLLLGRRKNITTLLSFLFFFFSLPTFLSSQTLSSARSISIGYPLLQEQLPENYTYNPLFLTTRIPIFVKENKRFVPYLEPQLAISSPPKPFKSAFEFGVNLGIQYYFGIKPKHHWTAAIGLGPHYLSLETAMQHKGFLFSDNIELGYYQVIRPKMGLQITTRFRHLSNANLQQPNLGIDNLFIMGGVFWTL